MVLVTEGALRRSLEARRAGVSLHTQKGGQCVDADLDGQAISSATQPPALTTSRSQ